MRVWGANSVVPGAPSLQEPMPKPESFELESPVPIPDEEDVETLAAIDEGIQDA